MNPHFKKPEVLEVKVGLRPGRTQVRLEAEEFFGLAGKKKVVIHNYGTGPLLFLSILKPFLE